MKTRAHKLEELEEYRVQKEKFARIFGSWSTDEIQEFEEWIVYIFTEIAKESGRPMGVCGCSKHNSDKSHGSGPVPPACCRCLRCPECKEKVMSFLYYPPIEGMIPLLPRHLQWCKGILRGG